MSTGMGPLWQHIRFLANRWFATRVIKMEQLEITRKNPNPEREARIAPLWRIDRQDGSSQVWDGWQIEVNDRRRHPRGGAVEQIISATYRLVESRR